MQNVAYLFNRYPESTLIALRREVEAISSTGLVVYRFAHRPSLQPLNSHKDRAEAAATQYLAVSSTRQLFVSILRIVLARPRYLAVALNAVFSTRSFGLRHFGHLAIACRLIVYLRKYQVDVLHGHFAGNAASVAMLARALGGPPWILTVHGPEDVAADNLAVLAAQARSASAVVAISEYSAASVRKAVLPDFIEPSVVGMGVDDVYLRPVVRIDQSHRLVCLARLVVRKGCFDLIEAIAILDAQGIGVHVDLVGDGPLRGPLLSALQRHQLLSNFCFHGWRPAEYISKLLDEATLLVLPSHSEGLPVSIMEAFARGRPVIATNVGSVSELVEDGVNGCLVPPHQPVSLARGIRRMMGYSCDTLHRMGLNGRAIVQERYNSRTNAERLVGIWRGVAAHDRPRVDISSA